MDKFSLIYNFNNSSPLFANVALNELEKNNIDRALEMLENGLQIHPEYPAGLIIYSKALAKLGEYDNAVDLLTKACEIIDSAETYDYYIKEFEKYKSTASGYSSTKRATFIPDDLEAPEENEEIVDLIRDVEETDPGPEIIPEIEDNLEELAKELFSAQMPPPEPELLQEEIINFDEIPEEPEEEQKEEREIVSETLAGIYFAQGNLDEALRIYQKLIEYQPEKTQFFKKRIAEIKEMIASGDIF